MPGPDIQRYPLPSSKASALTPKATSQSASSFSSWESISFAEPVSTLKSDMAASVLTEAAKNSEKEEFLDLLAENMQYQMPETFKEVEQGISDGRYSIGVTSEEASKAMLAAG